MRLLRQMPAGALGRVMRFTQHYASPLGGVTLESDGAALTGLWFDGQRGCGPVPDAVEAPLPVFDETRRWLDAYFRGEAPDFLPPLHLVATPFQSAVWQMLLRIPYGATVTYGALASALAAHTGRRVSARAVGGAVGRNPISLLIPCHRVVGARGALTGYAGGVERKARLLALERRRET